MPSNNNTISSLTPTDFHNEQSELSNDSTAIASSSTSHSLTPLPTPKAERSTSTSYFNLDDASFHRLSRVSSFASTLSNASTDVPADEPLINSSSNRPTRHTRSPRSRTSKRLHALYVHNYGALLVILAQFFGVLMNLSTRILETDGTHGRGVSLTPSFFCSIQTPLQHLSPPVKSLLAC